LHVGRPTGRPQILQCSLFVDLDWPTGQPTEMQSSLFELGRPCERPETPMTLFLAVDSRPPGRPATVQNPALPLIAIF